jgi:hypothetical protein
MNDQELNEWCKTLLGKVRDRWRDVRSKYPDVDVLEGGWGVLYSPIRLRPDLMIIGINPGGDRTDFNENEALQIPKQHEYFDCSFDNHGKPRNGYKLATKTVNVFSDMNLKDLLKGSVKLNLLFFRSRNWKHWETVKEPLRKELESFCADLVIEFIRFSSREQYWQKAKVRIASCATLLRKERYCPLRNSLTCHGVISRHNMRS